MIWAYSTSFVQTLPIYLYHLPVTGGKKLLKKVVFQACMAYFLPLHLFSPPPPKNLILIIIIFPLPSIFVCLSIRPFSNPSFPHSIAAAWFQ